MRENEYQARLIKKINRKFPGCLVLKLDPNYLQGIPDLLILFGDRWAALEVKATRDARTHPNQIHYICEMDEMSFAAFIYPENEKEVLDAIQQAFRPTRSARVSQR